MCNIKIKKKLLYYCGYYIDHIFESFILSSIVLYIPTSRRYISFLEKIKTKYG